VRSFGLAVLAWAVGSVGCHGSPPPASCEVCQPAPGDGVPCNGHAELCSRAYNDVTFPGTHDAYSDTDEHFLLPDQTHNLAKQLEDGVRVLHLEMIPNLPINDKALLCHALCAFGQTPLVDALGEVNDFLDAHPNEVVTLLTESKEVTTDLIAGAFSDSGLLPRVRTQAAGAPWPTLSDIIQSGQRVLVFHADMTATGGSSFPWMLDRFSWTWETPWDNVQLQDFSRCNADRGTKGNSLYVVDTYLEDPGVQSAANAARVNGNPFLLDRLLYCQKTAGARPNFAMVNYYEVGDLFHDVDVLNGFTAPDGDAGAVPPAAFDVDGGHD
jgi:hypothetical protein